MVSGIGGCGEVELGVFDPTSRKYASHTYRGVFEIVSLTGTVAKWNGEPYPHIHIAIAGSDNHVLGGHLLHCIISATGELVLQVMEKPVERKYYDRLGYTLFSF